MPTVERFTTAKGSETVSAGLVVRHCLLLAVVNRSTVGMIAAPGVLILDQIYMIKLVQKYPLVLKMLTVSHTVQCSVLIPNQHASVTVQLSLRCYRTLLHYLHVH